MNPAIVARWHELEPLLDAALDQPAQQRDGWLRANCEDPELRALALSLIAVDTRRATGLDARAEAIRARLEAQATALPEIPGYRVLHLLGEGGMASVFLAERLLGQTVQRVALKRLRLNVYDRDERRRFAHEHRILARLEHPNIAHLLDAGIAPDGVPWFAMEYIEGESLLVWCDARRLGVDARLAMFAELCAAVQHAHQQLVVHRDLKPSNILVDRNGRLKVLDFGIARLLDPDTGESPGTRTGLLRLTPGYAAPEQYQGQVSTATDVYVLGVILVELLGGQRPARNLPSGSDPLRGMAITDAIAQARSATPRALARLLSGEVGAIARKTLRRHPGSRYGSAQALADDVAALRSGRPVQARHGDWRYRAACFVRRNRAVVVAASLVAATLIAATAISLRQALLAREQAARALAVQAFVGDMLAPLRAGVPASRMPRLDEVLARGVRDLESRRNTDPAVYNELLTMFANTYQRMGDARAALPLAERVRAHGAAAFGPDDPHTLRALALRGRMRREVHGTTAQDRDELRSLLARMRRHGMAGVPLAETLEDLAALELNASRSGEASALFAQALSEREKELGLAHPDLAIGYANIGNAQFAYARPETSRAWFDKAYRHTVRHLGADTRQAAYYLGRIAASETYAGDLRDAERDYRAALAVFDRLGQRDHPERVPLLLGSCANAVQLDELARAEADCDAAMALVLHHWGRRSERYGYAGRYRVLVLSAQGHIHEAHSEGARIRAALAALPGEVPGNTRKLFDAYFSDVPMNEGDYTGMRDDLLRALRGKFNGRWPRLLPVWNARLALACAHAPDPACPPDLWARVDAQLADPALRGHSRRIEIELPLARLALDRGRITQANAYLDDVQAVAALPRLRLPASHRRLAEARMLRGDAFAAQGDATAARREWEAAEAVFAARYAADHPFRHGLAVRLRGPQPSAVADNDAKARRAPN